MIEGTCDDETVLRSFKTKAPGKLMLCGEWSVLEVSIPESCCIVLPITRYLCCDATLSKFAMPQKFFSVCLEMPDLCRDPVRLVWEASTGILREEDISIHAPSCAELAISAMQTALSFCSRCSNVLSMPDASCRLTVHVASEISTVGSEKLVDKSAICKPGLGSSSAAAVAIVHAVLGAVGLPQAIPELLFKLASIALYSIPAQSGGSCFDVAAASWKKPLYYRRFDPTWLESKISKCVVTETGRVRDGQAFADMVFSLSGTESSTAEAWPRLLVRPFAWDRHLRLAVCFSGRGASSKTLITRMATVRAAERAVDKKAHAALEAITSEVVAPAIKILEKHDLDKNDFAELSHLLKKNRELLQAFESGTGVKIETAALAKIADLGTCNSIDGTGACSVAKFSGAGGGDCALALVMSENEADLDPAKAFLNNRWREAGYWPIEDISVVQSDEA